jgi:hypothetical protein
MFKCTVSGVCCAAAVMMYTSGVWGMEKNDSLVSQEQSGSVTQKCLKNFSDWYNRCMTRTSETHKGYLALQKDYPHNKKKFEETQSAFEKILANLKQGTFNNPGMRLVLDYMYYWINIDPEQVYKLKIWKDPITGRGCMEIYEYIIRDLAAQILDELEQTEGLAYAYVHGH